MDELIRRGRALRAALTDDRNRMAPADMRLWQRDCEMAVRQLSGGNKAHWLSRAYSDALLVRTNDGRAVENADFVVIVDRIMAMLDRAVRALAEAREPGTAVVADGRAPTTRFDFVHDTELRPLLEQAYAVGRQALDECRYHDALLAFCGTLEATITDALVHRRPDNKRETTGLSFEARIAAAEQARLIRNGCARLPAAARAYRDPASPAGVTEADARTAGQVLRTIMRDLDPGR